MDDAFERLRQVDPVPEQLPPLPLELLLSRLNQQPAQPPQAASLTPRDRSRDFRRLPSIGTFLTAVSVAIALVFAVGAVALLARHGRSSLHSASPRSQTATPGRQQLIDMLSVLRRPQTKADIDRWLVGFVRQRNSKIGMAGSPDVPLMRRVMTSWGEKLYMVPLKPRSVIALRRIWERMSPPRVPMRRFIAANYVETLGVFTGNGGGGGSNTAADIQYAGLDGFAGARYVGLRPSQGGYQYLVQVVPDGVAKVVFVVRGHLGRRESGVSASPPRRTVPVTVHDNVAAARITRKGPSGEIGAIWYDQGGQVLKRTSWP